MPTSVKQKSSRKGQFSCNFCRARKLRCDRPLPCTSCKSRGKRCQFEPTPAVTEARLPTTTILGELTPLRQEQLTSLYLPAGPPPQQPSTPTQEDLLFEVQALRRLTQDLERRVVQSTSKHQPPPHGGEVSHTPTASNANEFSKTSLSDLSQVGEVVAHLQRVSRSQSSLEAACAEDVVFRIEHIRAIPHAPTHTAQLGKPTLCIWLPHVSESKVLLRHYLASLSHIQHVLHPPSLCKTIDDLYRRIDAQEPLQPGSVVLLLGIVANATHVWVASDGVHGERALFLSSAQAHAQTCLWIQAAHAVLNAAQNGAITLETVQGIIVLSFIVCNLEGVSLRYRSLISSGLLLGRELGLHRVDEETNAGTEDILTTEMGRRAWWYLVATDWLMAARFDGPGEGVYQAHPLHMAVNKPRNIHDDDLRDGEVPVSRPLCDPTDMSYFLQRIHLAEISRSIVDHNLMAVKSAGRSDYHAQVMAMDSKLEHMMHNIPPFFRLETYAQDAQSYQTSSIFLQAYMLNSLMHSQRCKLHLAYLTCGPNNNPTYTSSRDACLKSARYVIRAETQLLASNHAFVQIRLRVAAILYGVFIASIVLLMDACLHRPDAVQDEVQQGDLGAALRIIADMKTYSMAAARLHESLMQIVARYRAQQQQQQAHSANSGTGNASPSSSLAAGAFLDAHDELNPHPSAPQPSSVCDQQTHELDNTTYLDQLQWDDLFTGLAASSFF